ncbi:hypothetical protein J9174_09020 [Macrococcoides canis]|uniref:hypothetical protein n=1 Tax=Macrococcoides canis TaxID=1855823 RepID=UPI0013E99140|nr:hypothetical protein [Macrococcus canis]QIH76452.1 hypothetical protein GTN31_08770 [Macrococcus canis]QTQ07564.1 hypothetical protein J9174_09020 [Macrococcus canis]
MNTILNLHKKINGNSEKTSTVASVSYSIEDSVYQNISKKHIKQILNKKSEVNKFPKNLTFIDAYLDEATGMSACAFIDEEKGKVIVRFTGTNLDTGNIHGAKDDKNSI